MKNLIMSYDENEVTMTELMISCSNYDPWNVYGASSCPVGFFNCPFGYEKGEICGNVTKEMWAKILLDRRVKIC